VEEPRDERRALLERARDDDGDGMGGRIADAARRTLELRRSTNRARKGPDGTGRGVSIRRAAESETVAE
jgi:hypothetical protein